MKETTRGFTLVLTAYITWGVLPIYWALLSNLSPLTVLLHRVLWSMVLLAAFLLFKGGIQETVRKLCDRQIRNNLFLSSAFLGLNWLTYIYAMGKGEFVGASMGYFLCPLVQIAFGALFFKEKLTSAQKLSVLLMLSGIAIPIGIYGKVPWLALILAGSWAGYTMMRKKVVIGAHQGVFLETIILLPVLTVLACTTIGIEAVVPADGGMREALLLMTAGVVTALPQIWLVSGAKRIPMKYVGVMQYVAPSIMLAVSAFYFGKVPGESQILSITFIWVGIVLFFTGDYLIRQTRRSFPPALQPKRVRVEVVSK